MLEMLEYSHYQVRWTDFINFFYINAKDKSAATEMETKVEANI